MKKTSDELFFKRLKRVKLSNEQKELIDAIADKDKQIVFVNAKAGTGKTTIAVATAMYLYEMGYYDEIVYIFSPIGYDDVGFLPGSLIDKTSQFSDPLIQALIEVGEEPTKIIRQLNIQESGFIDAIPHTFLRGTNFDNAVVIIDEAQNMTVPELKKILTRVKDTCTVIVIGHDGQCDLKYKSDSGFRRYLDYFKPFKQTAVIELTQNFRGWLSNTADDFKE